MLSVAEFELFTFRPGPSLTRGEKVRTGQDCLIEFVQAVSWDGKGNELWLLQQCYNYQRHCLDGSHLPVVVNKLKITVVAFFFLFFNCGLALGIFVVRYWLFVIFLNYSVSS